MITISRKGTGFAVKVSEPGTGWRGYTVQARNLNEAIKATRHYYGSSASNDDPENYRAHINDDDPDCPLCRKLPRRSTWKEDRRR